MPAPTHLSRSQAFPRSIVVGLLIPVQSLANSMLGEAIGSFQYAVFGSLVVSFIIDITVLLIRPRHLSAFRLLLLTNSEMMYWFSGTPGAAYITMFARSIPVIGSTTAVVAAITGQMIMGLCLEWSKLAGKRGRAILGAVLTVCGTAIVVFGSTGFHAESSANATFFSYTVLMMLTGGSIVWQFAVIAKMKEVSSSAWAAATVSAFSGAMSALVIVIGFALWQGTSLITPLTNLPPLTFANCWWYSGGILGVGIIVLSGQAALALGARIHMVFVTLGYLLGGIMLDALNPPAVGNMWTTKLIGIGIVSIGVLVAKYEKKERTIPGS